MKYLLAPLSIIIVLGCSQQSHPLSAAEIAQIENNIIARSEKHASDLESMDYKSVMTFYAKDHIFFGDGYHWGDYLTIDGIWKDIVGKKGWKQMLKWDLQNHKVHVFSRDAASYLVEFDHTHLAHSGDTIRSSGCFSYGMQKIEGEWKAVTAHVSHIPLRTNDDKWWTKYSPARRND